MAELHGQTSQCNMDKTPYDPNCEQFGWGTYCSVCISGYYKNSTSHMCEPVPQGQTIDNCLVYYQANDKSIRCQRCGNSLAPDTEWKNCIRPRIPIAKCTQYKRNQPPYEKDYWCTMCEKSYYMDTHKQACLPQANVEQGCTMAGMFGKCAYCDYANNWFADRKDKCIKHPATESQ